MNFSIEDHVADIIRENDPERAAEAIANIMRSLAAPNTVYERIDGEVIETIKYCERIGNTIT